MHLIGTFVLHCLRHRILFYARYVHGKINQIINSRSHFYFLKLFVALHKGEIAFLLTVVFNRFLEKEIAMSFKTINNHKGDLMNVITF